MHLNCCLRVIRLKLEDEVFEDEVGRLLGNPMDLVSKVKSRINMSGLDWNNFMKSLK